MATKRKKSDIDLDLFLENKSPTKKKYKVISPTYEDELIGLKVGPVSDPEKYMLIQKLGTGVYGTTYKALNRNQKPNEKKYYAVKQFIQYEPIGLWNKLKSYYQDPIRLDWEVESQCLKDVFKICDKVGIICYKESFIHNKNYYIVTSLLEDYIDLYEYLKRLTKIPTDQKDQLLFEKIYSDVIDVKNALTQICISHNDMHTKNIMINPNTLDLKVIDLGICSTPNESGQKYEKVFRDESRLKDLILFLFMAYKSVNKIEKNQIPEFKTFMSYLENKYPILPYDPDCKR